MDQTMKTQKRKMALAIAFVLNFALVAQEPAVTEPHGHSHYAEHDSVAGHKLLFPSKTPDRIIANLTTDPAHSFAVNWRTDQQVHRGVVEVAVATDGPEFLLGEVRKSKQQRASGQGGLSLGRDIRFTTTYNLRL
jgi:hypothetical protein